jgi:hypothetical protein
MTDKELVKKLQKAMNDAGHTPKFAETGNYASKTESALPLYDFEITAKRKPEPEPVKSSGAFWMKAFNGLMGKKETDKSLQDLLVPYWKKLYGLGIKTLIGASAAFCGLGAGYIMYTNGLPVVKRGAAAKSWAGYGQAIDFKKNGLFEGAILHIDHDGDCKGDSNHVTFEYGDCTAEDLAKPKAVITGRGFNQGNAVKDSLFPVKHICAARWPEKDNDGKPIPLPGPVKVSRNCGKIGKTGESTR